MEWSLEAETSASNLTQYKLFTGNNQKKYALWSDLLLRVNNWGKAPREPALAKTHRPLSTESELEMHWESFL